MSWSAHPWAKGREAMLAAMTDEDRRAWLARRDADDLLYGAWVLWTRGLGPRP